MTDAVVLSAAQFSAAASLCVSARGLTAAALGCKPTTRVVLLRLGVIEERSCGSLEPLYHLTDLGRTLVCSHDDDGHGDSEGRSLPGGDSVGALNEGGEMSKTDMSPDPKPRRGKKPSAKRVSRPKPRAVAPKRVFTPPAPGTKKAELYTVTNQISGLKTRVKRGHGTPEVEARIAELEARQVVLRAEIRAEKDAAKLAA